MHHVKLAQMTAEIHKAQHGEAGRFCLFSVLLLITHSGGILHFILADFIPRHIFAFNSQTNTPSLMEKNSFGNAIH